MSHIHLFSNATFFWAFPPLRYGRAIRYIFLAGFDDAQPAKKDAAAIPNAELGKLINLSIL